MSTKLALMIITSKKIIMRKMIEECRWKKHEQKMGAKEM